MKFEYMIEHKRNALNATQLNRYGDAGWELVGVLPGRLPAAHMTYYFKREVPA